MRPYSAFNSLFIIARGIKLVNSFMGSFLIAVRGHVERKNARLFIRASPVLLLKISGSSSGMRWAGSHNSSERRTPNIRPFTRISTVLSPRIGYSIIPNALGGRCPARSLVHKSVLPLQINHSSSGMRWAGRCSNGERRWRSALLRKIRSARRFG